MSYDLYRQDTSRETSIPSSLSMRSGCTVARAQRSGARGKQVIVHEVARDGTGERPHLVALRKQVRW